MGSGRDTLTRYDECRHLFCGRIFVTASHKRRRNATHPYRHLLTPVVNATVPAISHRPNQRTDSRTNSCRHRRKPTEFRIGEKASIDKDADCPLSSRRDRVTTYTARTCALRIPRRNENIVRVTDGPGADKESLTTTQPTKS